MYDSTAAMQGVGAAKKLVPGPSPVLLLQCKTKNNKTGECPTSMQYQAVLQAPEN